MNKTWPVRTARPSVEKLRADYPLLTGQRVVKKKKELKIEKKPKTTFLSFILYIFSFIHCFFLTIFFLAPNFFFWFFLVGLLVSLCFGWYHLHSRRFWLWQDCYFAKFVEIFQFGYHCLRWLWRTVKTKEERRYRKTKN